jgi:ABC-type phosphate transport system permease subunit
MSLLTVPSVILGVFYMIFVVNYQAVWNNLSYLTASHDRKILFLNFFSYRTFLFTLIRDINLSVRISNYDE